MDAPPNQPATLPAPAPWTEHGVPTDPALHAVLALWNVRDRGLDPEQYHATDLIRRAASLRSAAQTNGAPHPDSVRQFETMLSQAMAQLASDLYIGRVNPQRVKFNFTVEGRRTNLAGIVRHLSEITDIDAALDSLEPPYEHYRALKRALKTYRNRPSYPEQEQQIRQIILTMERWRWMPRQLGNRFIVVNVSSFQLYAFDLSQSPTQPILVMPVVVGKAAQTPTPIFSGTMTHLFFRPYWNIPSGILRNETLPKLRRNPGALRSDRLEIVSAGAGDAPAKTYPATAANLSLVSSGRLRVRQKPGPRNALGRVKFMFPNQYAVYLHDTPSHALFDRTRRDFSHGCIRVSDPAALARFVLQGLPEWDSVAIDSAMSSAGRESRRVSLAESIPVYILYGTVLAEPSGQVNFYPDVYKLDAALEKALGMQGVPKREQNGDLTK